MGECGCAAGSRCYRLKAPQGYYVLQMNPGCSYCDAAPSIHLMLPETAKLYHNEELKHMDDLPTTGDGAEAVAVIICGITKSVAEEAATQVMVGAETEGGKIDDVLAAILGEDLWEHSLRQSPSVVSPGEKG